MKKTLIVFGSTMVLLTALFFGSFASVHAQSAQSAQTINVRGTGNVALAPDIATIGIAVSTEKESVEDAIDENTRIVEAVRKGLLDQGISEKDIRTVNYSLYSSQRQGSGAADAPMITTFTAYYSLEIKLRDISKLNVVLDACLSNGANNLQYVNYDSTQRADALQQARDLAIDDANANAASVAEKLGVTLGTLNSFSVRDYPVDSNTAVFKMQATGSAPMNSGDLVISVTVDLAYNFSVK